jgi:hypothetical protein
MEPLAKPALTNRNTQTKTLFIVFRVVIDERGRTQQAKRPGVGWKQ